MSTDILTILDFIGVISFTISGSLVAARKDMDYLGVCILGIVTAVGGGATRDVIIGSVPPLMFRNPTYVTLAFIVSNIVFFFLYFHLSGKSKPKMNHIFGKTLFWFDTVGLASFTVNGVIVGQTMTDGGIFLCAFLGVITGVGGGVLRDLLANEVPAIFVRHIYALASVAGAILACLLWNTSHFAAISAGLVSVILIRFLAKTYEWNLPHIHKS